jgi:hypothetical protein
VHICKKLGRKIPIIGTIFDEVVDTLQFQVNTGSSDEEDCSDNNSSGSDLSGIEPMDGP